jgi:hypothetical protein
MVVATVAKNRTRWSTLRRGDAGGRSATNRMSSPPSRRMKANASGSRPLSSARNASNLASNSSGRTWMKYIRASTVPRRASARAS